MDKTLEVGGWKAATVLKGDVPGQIWVVLSGTHAHNNQHFDLKMLLPDAIDLLQTLLRMSKGSGFDSLWKQE